MSNKTRISVPAPRPAAVSWARPAVAASPGAGLVTGGFARASAGPPAAGTTAIHPCGNDTTPVLTVWQACPAEPSTYMRTVRPLRVTAT